MSERWQRIIPGILISSWLVYLYFTYRAWQGVPDLLLAQPLARPAMPSPNPDRMWWLVAVSAAEAAFATLMMLPRWRRYYPLRALIAATVVLCVAVLLRPAISSPIDRVYLQWIAVVSILLLNISLVASFLWVVQRYAEQRSIF